MATPDFIIELRRHVGHAPLWLSGSSAVVLRPGPRTRQVLLVRRADTGAWTPICGIVEPGESPELTVVREAAEEAGVVVEVERLVRVGVSRPITYTNGDQCQFLDHDFVCRWVSGEPRVCDDESSEARFFDVDDLPPMSARHNARISVALDPPEQVILGGVEDADEHRRAGVRS